jgi:superfamily I DNA and/or RNA helicase
MNNYEKLKKVLKIEGSSVNLYSAILSAELVLKIKGLLTIKKILKEKGLTKKSIGIISPYKYQSHLIEGLISNQTEDKDIEVYASTVHKFQGEECDIIIVVLNPPNVSKVGNNSLLNNKNLLNVAISRARDYLFILMPDINCSAENLMELNNVLESLSPNVLSENVLEHILYRNSSLKEKVFISTHGKINAYGKNIGVKYEIKLDENNENSNDNLNSIDVFVNKE